MTDSTQCDRCGLHSDPTTMVQGICRVCNRRKIRVAPEELEALEWAIAGTPLRDAEYEALKSLRAKLRD